MKIRASHVYLTLLGIGGIFAAFKAWAGGGDDFPNMVQQKTIEVTVAIPPDPTNWWLIGITVLVGGVIPLLIWWLNNRGRRK